MKTRTSGAIGLSALLACSGLSHAGIKTFNDSVSNNFHDAGNWTPNGVPTHDDRVVIPSGETCNVVANGATVEFTIDTMEVDGVLNIDDGITLILENDDDNVAGGGLGPSSPDDTTIDGIVNVGASSGGTLFVKMLWPTLAEHVFGGDGTLRGFDDSVIRILGGDVFTSLLGASGANGIMGSFTIDTGSSATATFNNEGRIVADNNGLIVLDQFLILDDIADAIWEVNGTCQTGFSEMQFHRAATIDGDFVTDSHACFHFFEDVKTCGALVDEFCNGLEVESGVVFSYADYVGGMFCTNPGTDPGGVVDCDNPYTYDENDPLYCAGCP
jgi:hypothetical protein